MAADNAKKQIPLRLSPKLYAAIAQWAEDDFRSVNGQIEYLLSECVRQRKKSGASTPKEFDILELLARNKGIVLSIRKIYEEVWKEEFFKADNTVTVHITNLREKIEADSKAPVYIKTIWGAGYKI